MCSLCCSNVVWGDGRASCYNLIIQILFPALSLPVRILHQTGFSQEHKHECLISCSWYEMCASLIPCLVLLLFTGPDHTPGLLRSVDISVEIARGRMICGQVMRPVIFACAMVFFTHTGCLFYQSLISYASRPYSFDLICTYAPVVPFSFFRQYYCIKMAQLSTGQYLILIRYTFCASVSN